MPGVALSLWRPSPLPGANPWVTPQSRLWVAAALAFVGAANPLPIPLVGLHKLYLGQPMWGGAYWVLGWTPLPRIACVLEGVWYVAIASGSLAATWAQVRAAQGLAMAQQTQAIAAALRDLEHLRQEGLLTEQEFERQRRQLIDPHDA